MKDAHARQKEAERLDGTCTDKVPASDPISPGAAMHAERRVATGKDDIDWKLKPGADHPHGTLGKREGPGR